ncbi:Neural/ectodermal development factor IMP-L2-like Protein [Tribolium castaneum]|uniref:Neural/ectodermal development factor IMP-L2-like Protein n=1 Tax=Tribolium castaneum TaxID=7070 RepID=A0A139WG26_TRICA|nr:Neural/ectodermal development factor IMP-L2-like Protein [Tribolium castaneum]
MFQVLLSVLLVAFQVANCRRLTDDMDNEISVASGSMAYRDQDEWIKISAPPKPVISKTVGSYVELECEAMGSPPPTLQWLRGKTPLTEHQSFESNMISETPSEGLGKIKARLVINYLLPVHSGRFTCVAESGSKIVTADSTIYVIKKEGFEHNFTQVLTTKILGAHHVPRISLWAPTYMDVIGTNVILPCRTLGNPKPSQMWIDPQGQIIGENDLRVSALPDGSLSIRSLSWADMGVYTCVARNMVGQDSVETFLYPMKVQF